MGLGFLSLGSAKFPRFLPAFVEDRERRQQLFGSFEAYKPTSKGHIFAICRFRDPRMQTGDMDPDQAS